jgi:hypothetical protein
MNESVRGSGKILVSEGMKGFLRRIPSLLSTRKEDWCHSRHSTIYFTRKKAVQSKMKERSPLNRWIWNLLVLHTKHHFTVLTPPVEDIHRKKISELKKKKKMQ